MAEPVTEESECFSFLLAPLNSVAYDVVKHISLSMPFIVTENWKQFHVVLNNKSRPLCFIVV